MRVCFAVIQGGWPLLDVYSVLFILINYIYQKKKILNRFLSICDWGGRVILSNIQKYNNLYEIIIIIIKRRVHLDKTLNTPHLVL